MKVQISTTNRYAEWIRPLLHLIVDYFAFLAAEATTIWLGGIYNGHPVQVNYFHFFFVFPAIMLTCLQAKRLYSRMAQFWQIVEKICHAVVYAFFLFVLEVHIANLHILDNKPFIFIFAFISFVYIVIERYAVRKILVKNNLFMNPVLIVGAGETAALMVRGFKSRNIGYEIIGFLEDNEVHPDLKNYPILGGFKDAEKVIKETGVKHVFIVAPGANHEILARMICLIQPLVKRLTIVPNAIGIPMGALSIESLFNEKMMLLNVQNNLASVLNRALKRVFDLVATICGGLVISPILLYVAYKIHKDSPGPVIYDGPRIGQNGEEFKCYKFRSMYTNGDEILEKYLKEHPEKREQWEVYHKLDDDPRITPIGKFIRKTSIDELPQLLNVVLGDMSLVGPRPYLPREKEDMGTAYDTIILAKPGITGYWQVSGRNDITFEDRLNLESWYVYNWSFWMDMELLVKTVMVVLKRNGAK